MSVNVQKQIERFLMVTLLVALAGAVALNVVPNSRLESYLLKIGLISLVVTLSLISVEFAQGNQNIVNKGIVINVFIGIRLIAEVLAYWRTRVLRLPQHQEMSVSFLHYALNPKM